MTGMPRVNINLGEALWDYVKKPVIIAAAIAAIAGVAYSSKLIMDNLRTPTAAEDTNRFSVDKPGMLELHFGVKTLDADGDGKVDLRVRSNLNPNELDYLFLNKGDGMYRMVPVTTKDGKSQYCLPGEPCRPLPPL